MRKWIGSNIRTILIFAAAGLAASGCTNGRQIKATPSPTPGSLQIATQYDSFTISRVEVVLPSPTPSATAAIPATLYFDTSSTASSNVLTAVCDTASLLSSKPCVCQFSWNEINSVTSPAVTISRLVQTSVTAVQAGAVTCPMPDAFRTEISSGTAISITVMPGSGNSNAFNTTTITYTKGSSQETGSFQDSQGRAYINVLRYACHDQRQRGLAFINRLSKRENTSANQTSWFPLANRYCVQKVDGTATATDGTCSSLPPADYTAQSYYYNLYIRSNEVGDINPTNGSFVCPTVHEALNSSSSGGSSGQYWPLDQSFSLSMGKTTDFNVGVVANTKLSNPNDPSSASTVCEGASATAPSGSALITSCLGFAAKPNTDGTCPSFTDSSGVTQQTYRLRRYMAIYPPLFDTTGFALDESQRVDTIYVIDRPVYAVGGALDKTGVIASTGGIQYAMLGPKPCPFAFYDNKGAINATGQYYATNNASWDGKNVDGIKFPNTDALATSTTPASCSAVLPLVSDDQAHITAFTVHSSNANAISAGLLDASGNRWIRPISSWAPHYEEDISFKACAPLANPLRDPPLHFRKTSTNNVAWCAEAYPSQNNNIPFLDKTLAGNVKNYTSHVVKGVSGGTACTPTNASPGLTIPAGYAAGGFARHLVDTTTCDRTVVNPISGAPWPRFPLLAPEGDVENAMLNDDSYSCMISRDAGGTGTAVGKRSPSQGCCTVVNIATGAGGATTSAHLEPSSTPTTPSACSTSLPDL